MLGSPFFRADKQGAAVHTLLAERGCRHDFVQGLVCRTPYVRIAKVARQQPGEVMEILAVQVTGQLVGKGFDLLELCFAKCNRHWFSFVVLSVITEIDQRGLQQGVSAPCGAQNENTLNKKLTVLI